MARAVGSENGPIWALGMMSGTSLDGVDAALVQTDGTRVFAFGPSAYTDYTDAQRAELRAALGQWPDGSEVKNAARVGEAAHIALAQTLVAGNPTDLLGYHGQTLAHDPANARTHQAGDGQVLADALEVPVVWDFRSQDVAEGGEGAPLAPFFHHACARFIGAEAPIAFLNLGGVGNVTWVDPRIDAPEAPDACLAFDTGPANAPINDLMQVRRGIALDQGGALALSGTANTEFVQSFLAHPYFTRQPPKSLDRDAFPDLLTSVADLPDADAVRTLAACAVEAVAQGMRHCPSPPTALLVTGGGRKNAALMQELSARLSVPVQDIDDTGLDGDMLEAQAFAYLAVRVARGLPTSAPSTTGVAVPVGGGRVSYPLS
ncbi:Anhydro-N-acetylmuramic acid kinase [Aliiroseovarius pelagivivens]|uniref:Anhydro-N-acetylmuramic acid kinase n=1 Tax=Aliiroseovarius pelagivivens TaxID=1639690 RepID=A0A2R8AKI9_9RHOB|nr:anhydro-N-acetylmuramic acid kinase [Aliiroseovarius pelagivivens]SPF76565.1 Anhydro-N-acetylmuramic acid kinase [Aliiroseovarius pelagivivens]